jgi:predicted dehydrogenase
MAPIKVAIIGLDTSHSIQFSKLMNAADCPQELKVPGMQAISCMRFETPFQDKKGLDERQAQHEGWGVKVTEDLDEALAGCDAVMLEINDPAYHLEYFAKVAALGKPVFLDKPLAGNLADGRAIIELARQHGTRVWSGSSLPFADAIRDALAQVPDVKIGHSFGALGTAPAGDSLIWYGVHSFEMLQKVMGAGAREVTAVESEVGVVSVVEYEGERRGVVESIRGSWTYGGRVQSAKQMVQFLVDGKYNYRNLLREVKAFFEGGPAPVSLETSFEGLAMMVAARDSIDSGKAVSVENL